MKKIKDILKKYGAYPEELLKELEEYKTQAIKQAFDEERKTLEPYFIPREIKRIRMAQDKFLKI